MTKKQDDDKSAKKGKDAAEEVRRDDVRTGTAAYPEGQDPSQTQK